MIIFRDGTKDTKRGKFQVIGCLTVITLSHVCFLDVLTEKIPATQYRSHVDIFICIEMARERNRGTKNNFFDHQ